MKNKKRYHNLTFLSVLFLLICFLCLSVTGTSSWFTSGSGLKVEMTVHLGNLNLSVYQVIGANEYQINSFEDAGTTGTNVRDYVDLSNDGNLTIILPDEEYSLEMVIKNLDDGTEAMYLRYKMEIVVNYYNGSSVTSLTLMPTLLGYTSNSSSNGFAFNEDDGYYYYENSSGEIASLTNTGTTALTLFDHFSIPYSEFYDNDMSVISGATLKMILTIECEDTAWSI